MLVLAIPDAQLRRQVACPESLVALSVRGVGGVPGSYHGGYATSGWSAARIFDPDAAAS
jgi:hypothetical protein